jgi:hypothetical protein
LGSVFTFKKIMKVFLIITVHRVLAHDKDDGVNGKIFYTIDGRLL